jgi:hypothetical protein
VRLRLWLRVALVVGRSEAAAHSTVAAAEAHKAKKTRDETH